MSIYVDDKLVTFTKYPNGETVVPAITLDTRRRDHVVRLHWESDVDLVHLVLVRGLVGQLLPKDPFFAPDLFIDYMPYSRMDRAQDDHCFSLRYVAGVISAQKWRKIEVVEPHSEVTTGLLGAEPIWATATLTPKVMRATGFDKECDYLVFPDAGAVKRYTDLMPDIVASCHLVVMKKVRDFATGKITGLDIDHTLLRGRGAAGRKPNALIVDDLSSRGGTFVQAADILRDVVGCEKVSLLVTHMEPVGLTGDLPKKLDRVFCTDTMTLPRPLPGNFELFQRSDWL